MRAKLLSILVYSLVLLTIVSVVPPAYAIEKGEWIKKYKVVEANTGQLLMEVDFAKGVNITYAPILEGAELEITFTIDVVVTGGTLRLSTSMLHSQVHDTFWSLVTVNYTSNFVSYNPNSAAVEFNAAAGTFEMIVYGRIKDYPATTVFPVPLNAVTLASSAGDVIDQIQLKIVNAAVDEYLKLLEQKEDKLQSLKDSGVAAGYVELYENVIEQAKAEQAKGDTEDAIALLEGLNVSNEPASSFMEALFLPILGALAAVAVVFAFMFMRARGKVAYFLSVIEDQIKDLEGLTLRATKIDRTIGASLDSIKDRLMRLVGA